MTKREFQKKMIEEGAPPKMVKIVAAAAEEIFRLEEKAHKLAADGRTDEADTVAKEIAKWLNGMQSFVTSTAKWLTGECEEE